MRAATTSMHYVPTPSRDSCHLATPAWPQSFLFPCLDTPHCRHIPQRTFKWHKVSNLEQPGQPVSCDTGVCHSAHTQRSTVAGFAKAGPRDCITALMSAQAPHAAYLCSYGPRDRGQCPQFAWVAGRYGECDKKCGGGVALRCSLCSDVQFVDREGGGGGGRCTDALGMAQDRGLH